MTRVHTAGNGQPRAASRSLILFLRVVQALLAFATVALLFGAVMFATGMADSLFNENPEVGGEEFGGMLAFASLTGAVFAATWFIVIGLLVRVVRTIQDGEPFVEANIARLRWMWVLILGAEVFRIVVHALADISIRANSVTPAETGLDIRISTVFLVLFIASLGAAFRHGVELRRDAELTI